MLLSHLKSDDFLCKHYDYGMFIRKSDPSLVGLQSLEFHKFRYCVFCASMNPDSLNMWNYYVKGSNYEGYNIRIDAMKLAQHLETVGDNRTKFLYGPVLYQDGRKKKLLKETILNFDRQISSLPKFDSYENYTIERDKLYSGLISYIENYRLFFKHYTFAGEKEFRFILRIPKKIKNDDKEIDAGFDVKRGIIVPHFDVHFSSDKASAIIKKIGISPTTESALAIEGLDQFLNRYDYNLNPRKDIIPSKIPIRY